MMEQLKSSIKAVIVYPDRARVTRQGSTRLKQGLFTLIFAELPVNLNPDSLNARAHGTARARLLGVQVQRSFFSETPAEQTRQLEQQIDMLQDELKKLDAQAELKRQNRQVLDKLANHTELFATALAAGEMDVDTQLTILDGLSNRAEQLDETLQELATQRRSLDRKLQQLTKELEQQRSTRPRERYQAHIEIEVLQAGELTVELSYVVAGARWKPIYDLRLLEGEGQPSIELGYLAQVGQNTGEDWDQVDLCLSTARPALTRILPELDPWFIGPPEPIMPIKLADASPGVPQAMARAAHTRKRVQLMEAAPELLPAEEVGAAVDSTGTSVTYRIPTPVTIPPDGSLHKVTVARFPLTPQLDYVCAPRLVPAAYRRARISNSSVYTLLPGEVSLFIGDEYIGSTSMELTAPQGEIKLYLGNEDRVKVERELKRRDVDKRLIGGKRYLAVGYAIKLENHLPFMVKLTVHDQFPVSRHEDIKVKLESTDPKPAEVSEMNLLRWELNLDPGEKRTVRFDFIVESPHGMDIIGIPS